MTVCSLYLLVLDPTTTSIAHCLRTLCAAQARPLIAARPIRWMVLPEKLTTGALLNPLNASDSDDGPKGPYSRDALPPTTTSTPWDLFVVFPEQTALPTQIAALVRSYFHVDIGIDLKDIETYPERNRQFLYPMAGEVPPLTEASRNPIFANSMQDLALTHELKDWSENYWIHQGEAGRGAVSMLNFLAFNPGGEPNHYDEYQKYGQKFMESVGPPRGGGIKFKANIIGGAGFQKEGPGEWEDVILAHYPSIRHFTDMAGGEDYQRINHTYRLGKYKDTCILFASELDPEVLKGMANA